MYLCSTRQPEGREACPALDVISNGLHVESRPRGELRVRRLLLEHGHRPPAALVEELEPCAEGDGLERRRLERPLGRLRHEEGGVHPLKQPRRGGGRAVLSSSRRALRLGRSRGGGAPPDAAVAQCLAALDLIHHVDHRVRPLGLVVAHHLGCVPAQLAVPVDLDRLPHQRRAPRLVERRRALLRRGGRDLLRAGRGLRRGGRSLARLVASSRHLCHRRVDRLLQQLLHAQWLRLDAFDAGRILCAFLALEALPGGRDVIVLALPASLAQTPPGRRCPHPQLLIDQLR
mmetsp:Transcript_36866/g.93468  ORF Transcript_36866/g.93468 Transcript_36866/m.93468 type:complete len:288 (+) Transcript_36866:354-1217(+)